MDQQDSPLPELEQANAKLRASLKQCRDMVADYRSKIAANAHVRQRPDDGGEPDQAG